MNTAHFPLQNACGCCTGIGQRSPVLIHNRPGLSAITYRIGDHADVLASMVARLSSKDFPALSRLRTRESDDFSIALLDAYACVADVLTFYQERIANESYLRSAGERYSLQELARLISYRLNPGVAAETWLAFTVEDAAGAPDQVRLDRGTRVQSVPGQDEKPQTFETVEEIAARPQWNLLKPQTGKLITPTAGSEVIYLHGTATRLNAGDALLFVGSEREADSGSPHWAFRRIQSVVIDSEAGRTIVALDSALGPTTAANPGVYALRLRTSLFGHNAPDWRIMSDEIKRGYLGLGPGETVVATQWPGFTIADVSDPPDAAATGTVLHLASTHPQIVPGSWLVLSIPGHHELYQVESAGEDSRASFTLTGKTTRLVVKGVNLREQFNEMLRETAVFAQSEQLALAETPVTGDVAGTFVTLDREASGLEPGHRLLLTGVTTEGEEASEVLTLAGIEPDGAASKLSFTSALQNDYIRQTVGLYGNIALATHGETVHQILGNGDAGRSHQDFLLKHAPLTHVRADTESGAEAALEVRVNDIAWDEVHTLYASVAGDHSYVVRVAEDGSAIIRFGDGQRGARLPTGQENVRAIYRKGIGSAGNLRAGQLSQLMSRPLGLKAVFNPQESSGGVDAEDADAARSNIPLGVRTLGRAVSLRDYEDFARAYTGIAKAQARVMQIHGVRTIHITVAGKNAERPEQGGPLLNKLLASLRKNSDPQVACDAAPYNEAYFKLALRIKWRADHDRDVVLAAVESTLRQAFSFDARDFGQCVARSEVIAVAQQVTGVAAVDVDRFYRGATPDLEDRLVPESASLDGSGNAVAGELLLLAPGPLDYLEELP